MGEPEEWRLAEELAREIRENGRPVPVRLRELRDLHLKQERLTVQRRRELQRAFEAQNLVCSVPLTEASLDEVIEVSGVRSGRMHRFYTGVVRPLFSGVRGIALLLGLIAAVVALYPLIKGPADPEPMSGDVNLLVAGFADRNSAADGIGLGETLFRSLHASTRPTRDPEDPDIQIRGPEAVGPIVSAEEAATVAAENGAQIVIYGRVAHQPSGTFVLPHFYVDPHLLQGAEELGGDFPLPAIDMGPGEVAAALSGRARFRGTVSEDFHALSAFAVGLGWFNSARWQRARTWFDRSQERWRGGMGAALSNLFLANTASKLGEVGAAQAAYDRALHHVPGFQRAHLGQVQIELYRVGRNCPTEVNGRQLRDVASAFAQLYNEATGSGLPHRAFLLRARLGEARTNLCLGILGSEKRAAAAARGFRETIELASGIGSFRPEVAEAQAGLGLSELQSAARFDRRAYRRARTRYVRARRLTNDPARVRSFSRVISLIDARIDAPESVWSRTDPLPAGIQAEVEYHGVGDSVCGPTHPGRPQILTDRRPFYQFEFVEDADDPELGETFSLCPRGLPSTGPVTLVVQGPEGFQRRVLLPATKDELTRYVTYFLGREWPVGTYSAFASQGETTARLSFAVVLPRHRGVRVPIMVARRRPEPLPVMVVGRPPLETVIVDVYRQPGDPRNPSMDPHRYSTSFTLKTDENGIAETDLPAEPDDQGSFVLRVRGLGSYENQDLVATVSFCDGGEC